MNESKPQLADGVRKNGEFTQEESAMPNLPETPAGHGPGNEKRSMIETTAPIASKTDDDPAKRNETSVQEEAAAPAVPATEAVPGQVIAFPRRDSAAGTEIIPNVVVHTVAGTAAKIVVVSSGFGAIRQLDIQQSAGGRSSQHIRMAA